MLSLTDIKLSIESIMNLAAIKHHTFFPPFNTMHNLRSLKSLKPFSASKTVVRSVLYALNVITAPYHCFASATPCKHL